MHGTPESDGVPGVTQDPIQPGETYVYRFLATQHGSFWYHSHQQGQIEDGLYGAISIRPRAGDAKPFALVAAAEAEADAAGAGAADAVRAMEAAERRARPLVISDLSRLESTAKWDMTLAVGVEVSCYDALLFNGKGRVSCLAADDMAARLGPVQQQDLALVPGSELTDKGPVQLYAGGARERFAVASSIKLYILGALIDEVNRGKRRPEDVMLLRRDRIAPPSSEMAGWPVGSPATLHTYALKMISISDNTATDHLIHLLGRRRVEAQMQAMGHSVGPVAA